MKEEKANKIFTSLGSKTPLNNIPLLGKTLF